MSIWKRAFSPSELNAFMKHTLIGHLGIEVIEVGDDWVKATLPVVDHNKQPMGFLHGGASVVLAESLGSLAAHMTCEEGKLSFGVEVNANHIKSVRDGIVTGVTKPLKLGKSLQVWDTQISNQAGDLVCASRLTVAIRDV